VNNPAEVNEKTLYIRPSEIRRSRATLYHLEGLLVLAHRPTMAFYDGTVKLSNPDTSTWRLSRSILIPGEDIAKKVAKGTAGGPECV
jgi:hypothetical protein